MPKLSDKCLSDIKRYINLRYDHKGDEWIQNRIRKVIRALKRETKEVQYNYSENVDSFFERNKDILEQARKAEISHKNSQVEKANCFYINGNNNKQH